MPLHTYPYRLLGGVLPLLDTLRSGLYPLVPTKIFAIIPGHSTRGTTQSGPTLRMERPARGSCGRIISAGLRTHTHVPNQADAHPAYSHGSRTTHPVLAPVARTRAHGNLHAYYAPAGVYSGLANPGGQQMSRLAARDGLASRASAKPSGHGARARFY